MNFILFLTFAHAHARSLCREREECLGDRFAMYLLLCISRCNDDCHDRIRGLASLSNYFFSLLYFIPLMVGWMKIRFDLSFFSKKNIFFLRYSWFKITENYFLLAAVDRQRVRVSLFEFVANSHLLFGFWNHPHLSHAVSTQELCQSSFRYCILFILGRLM